MGEQASQQLMMAPYGLQNQPVITSNMALPSGHMIANPGHMMPMGFSPAVVGGSPTGTPPHIPKGRGPEGVLAGSPRIPPDKVKLRIHQVRNDDFKMQVKPDRRRRKWRGKDKDIVLSSKSELAESAVRRMGIFNETAVPMAASREVAPIPALPASLGVEPGLAKSHHMPPMVAEQQGRINPPSAATSNGGHSDSNYALNMLADMSSKQSKEGRPLPHHQEEALRNNNRGVPHGSALVPPNSNGADDPSNVPRPHLRSPVSLAARSLLMLGEDLNITDKSGDVDRRETTKPADVENTAATSLLQLSGAVADSATSGYPPDGTQGEQQEGLSQPRSTRSASFSAAEAMIMMGTGSDEKEPAASPDVIATPPPTQPVPETAVRDSVSKPRSLTIDSEATDTDSEATLTPESPRVRKRSSFIMADTGRLPVMDISSEETKDTEGEEVANDIGADTKPSGFVMSFDLESGGSQPPVATQSPEFQLLEEGAMKPPVTGDLAEGSNECSTVDVRSYEQDIPRENDIGSDSPQTVTYPLGESTVNPMEEEEAQSSPIPSQASALQAPSVAGSVPSHCDELPPAAKRPKFISTFAPAADSGLHSAFDGESPTLPMPEERVTVDREERRSSEEKSGFHSIVPLISSEKLDSHSSASKEVSEETMIFEKAGGSDSHSMAEDRVDESDSYVMEPPVSLDRAETITSSMVIAEATARSHKALDSVPAPLEPANTEVSNITTNDFLQNESASDTDVGRAESRVRVESTVGCEQNSNELDVDTKSVEISHKKSPIQANTSPLQDESKGSSVETIVLSSSVVSEGKATNAPKKIKVKKNRDALISKTKSSGIKRVIKIKRAKSPKLAKTVAEVSSPALSGSDGGDVTAEKPSPSSWAAFADAAMEDNQESPSVSKHSTPKSPPRESGVSEVARIDSTKQSSKDTTDLRVSLPDDLPVVEGSGSSADKGSSTPDLPAVVAPQNRLKISRPDGSRSPRDYLHHHHKRASGLGSSGRGKSEDKLFGKPDKEARSDDKVSGKRPLSTALQERKSEVGSSKEERKIVESGGVAGKDGEGGALHVKKLKSSSKASPRRTEKDRLKGEVEKAKELSLRTFSDSDDSTAISSHAMDTQGWDSIRESDSRPPRPSFPLQGSQDQPRVSPSRQSHSPFSISTKGHDSEFSPLSDDDFSKFAPPSRHSVAKESRPVKWSEDEDWKQQKSHRRHQGGGSGLDDASLSSPASSLGSSGSKKHRQRHHHHHDRLAGSSGEVQYPPPLGPKHEHYTSNKRSSRGPASPEHSKRHHHHHHRHRSGDRHHHTHEHGSNRNPANLSIASSKRGYESISDDDLFKEREDHLSRRSLHESTKTTEGSSSSSSRKRRRISSDSADASGDPLPVTSGHSSSSGSGKHKKMKKHSSKDHKERRKDESGSGKHKHSHK